jgi:hypothetical protein
MLQTVHIRICLTSEQSFKVHTVAVLFLSICMGVIILFGHTYFDETVYWESLLTTVISTETGQHGSLLNSEPQIYFRQ